MTKINSLTMTESRPMEPEDLKVQIQKVSNLESELSHLQGIMKRIDTDSYGRCEACGAEIDQEVLSSNPATILCATHDAENESLL